ncbi:uncharacterized protein LOC123904170 [Trifolium pratense]|uniref:Uncharacterized protein n=1 Tax=Trifolium pratense TaxID=57577 RepID=A0ACB0JPU8_TRIPR|nr:uncharacterized protein LOC123904170 [Trifolium pratense]CAJ2646347.1 unnamed protein product [Trifolium pratense]
MSTSASTSVAQSSQAAPPTQADDSMQSCRQKSDPAWDYCTYVVEGRNKRFTCMFCKKVIKGGGIHRLKKHLAGVVGDVKICKTVDADTRFRMLESLNETSTKKKRAAETFDDEHPFGPNVVELADDDTSEIPRPAVHVSSSSRPPKRAATSQEVGSFFAPRTTPGAQPTIKSVLADMWWNTFGHSVPNVQKWAIKILSQTASSSGCERNWSVFERIHTKKRNRLEHQRLNDLVFVHYNLRLKNRAFNKMGAYDPIDYERIDDIEFWIMDEDTNSTPILDSNEIESMLYNEESIPIIGIDNEEGELAPTIGLQEGDLIWIHFHKKM